MQLFDFLPSSPFYLAFDNEGPAVDGGNDDGGSHDDAGVKVDADKTNVNKTEAGKKEAEKLLSQTEVNRILAAERRKHEKTVNQTIKQLEEMKAAQGASEQTRQQLETQIEELRNSLLSREEIAKKEKQKIEQEAKRQAELLSKERDDWRGKFEDEVKTNALLAAAAKADVYNPKLVLDLLLPKTRLTEARDKDGNVIPGKYVPVVKLEETDKDGNIQIVEYPVAKAFEILKDRPDEYAGLFKAGVAGGLGGTSGRQVPPKDIAKMTHKEYLEYRKKQPWAPIGVRAR